MRSWPKFTLQVIIKSGFIICFFIYHFYHFTFSTQLTIEFIVHLGISSEYLSFRLQSTVACTSKLVNGDGHSCKYTFWSDILWCFCAKYIANFLFHVFWISFLISDVGGVCDVDWWKFLFPWCTDAHFTG